MLGESGVESQSARLKMSDEDVSRRDFLKGVLAGAAVTAGAGWTSGCGYFEPISVPSVREPHPSWTDSRAASRLGEDATHTERLRVVSYNCHHYRGRKDNRTDPERIGEVLASLDPDIVALQESDLRDHADSGRSRLEVVADRVGLQPVIHPDKMTPLCWRGNAILSRFPARAIRWYNLTVPGHNKRGAVDVELQLGHATLRIVGAHLGLDRDERAQQVGYLLDSIMRRPRRHGTVVMGDFNIWMGSSMNLAHLERYLGPSKGTKTYPSNMPVFQLDRIFASPGPLMRRIRVHRDALAEDASDHLPIWSDIVV